MIPEWSHGEALKVMDEYIGIPYKNLGVSRDGVYCAGFVVLFYRDHGLSVPDPATDNFKEGRESDFSRVWRPVQSPLYGDLVTMRGEQDPYQGHLGIYTPIGCLHALRNVGVVCQKWDARIRARVTGYYRYAGCPAIPQ